MDIKPLFQSTVGKASGVMVGVVALLVAVWNVDDRYAKAGEVDALKTRIEQEIEASEARIISEVRSESAETRLILIEDMESRLDEFDYDISILESNSQVVPESLRIKRNMLERRIKRLNHENIDDSDSY